jgi:hypothetical protein
VVNVKDEFRVAFEVHAERLRRETAAVDPRLAAFGMATLGEALELSVTQERFQSGLMATFALVALVLAMVGVYGVASCAVGARSESAWPSGPPGPA